MDRLIVLLAALMGMFFAALPVNAEDYTLTGRVTMAPVVTGPSGYVAALNTGETPHLFELERLGGDLVALHVPWNGYLRAGYTQWNYLSITEGAIDDSARFILERSGDQARLRSVLTGLYVGYNLRSGRLRAAFPEAEANTLWLMQRTDFVTGDAVDDTGFLGQRWPVQAFRDGQGRWITPSPAQSARMLISPRQSDGARVQIDTLCDSFDSAFVLQPPHIQFIAFENTRYACPDADRAMSQAFLDVLARAQRIDRGDRRVRLLDDAGDAIAVFQR